MPRRVAIFDFCDTLVEGQCAELFTDYCMKRRSSGRYYWLYKIFSSKFLKHFLRKLSFDSINYKLALLFFLRGLREQELLGFAEGFVREELLERSIAPVISDLKSLHEDGCEIWLVSGGYEVYLRYWMPDFVDRVVACDIEILNGRVTGRLSGQDCMGKAKVHRIETDLSEVVVDYVYSDSVTDLPMLKLANHPIVVSRESGQQWVVEYGFIEKIWLI